MATELGEITSYKRLYMQFRDSAANTINLTLNNPKNVEDGDYVDFAAQNVAVEGVMDTIIAKNIFHNNGNDLVAKVNARIPVSYTHLRAHETRHDLVCRLLLEKKKKNKKKE